MTYTNMPVVIVTGASRGLGAAVARWLAKARAAVTLISRSEDRLNDVAGEIRSLGGKPLVFTADVSSSDDCRSAVELTLDRFGRIDALVNNAGIIQPISSIAHTEPDNWRHNIEVNLMGPFYMIQAAISSLRIQNGRIVNVSSGAATRVMKNASAYCAAKAALNHFTRVLAEEEPGLTALTIRPGVVDTDMQATIRNEGLNAMSDEQLAYYRQLKANGKLEPPEIPGRSIAWLALHAPTEFSGQFFDYDDPRIAKPALRAFGKK
ncbi:MAG: SDR family NAD(P)-dependent oxidoreductase [Desulfobacterales bacterium]|jgi:NAD(P)-dependent dehydrogenase (short-subunit alcohol dehydrogenase family)